MKKMLFTLLCFVCTSSFAQTKAIAFKSHSGDMKNFSIALQNELFSDEGSNFGIPSWTQSYRLASVKYISRSKAVLKTYIYHKERRDTTDHGKYYATRMDTVYDHPLFSRKHALDSIKQVLKNSKEYDNPVEEIIFIGYDNYIKVNSPKQKKNNVKTDSTKENNFLPVVPGNNVTPGSLFDAKMVKALAGIFLLALLSGWCSWKYAGSKIKKQQFIPGQLTTG